MKFDRLLHALTQQELAKGFTTEAFMLHWRVPAETTQLTDQGVVCSAPHNRGIALVK